MGNKFINYAHRGASEYAPENTMMAFYLGMHMGANGIETDVRLTKDGVAVLFHDGTLERMCSAPGGVADYTYEELQKITARKGNIYDQIPTLDDFLRLFSFRPITFAIELKAVGVASETARLLRKYNMVDKTVVTSFIFDELVRFRECAPEFKTGYLTSNITDELLAKMKELGIREICPEAALANRETVQKWHDMGFNVRAWGVYNEELMKQAYDAGCNGMTVNFPDKLVAYIKSKQ